MENFEFKECTNCGYPITTEGYVFRQGEHYACSELCRDLVCIEIYDTTWEEEYDEDGDSYYTCWD
jgi:hypothetical protein